MDENRTTFRIRCDSFLASVANAPAFESMILNLEGIDSFAPEAAIPQLSFPSDIRATPSFAPG